MSRTDEKEDPSEGSATNTTATSARSGARGLSGRIAMLRAAQKKPQVTENNRAYVPERYGCLAQSEAVSHLYLATAGITACLGLALGFSAGGQQWGFLAHLDGASLGLSRDPDEMRLSICNELASLRAYLRSPDGANASEAELDEAKLTLVRAGGMGAEGDGGLRALIEEELSRLTKSTFELVESDSVVLELSKGVVHPYLESSIPIDRTETDDIWGMSRTELDISKARDMLMLNHTDDIHSVYLGYGVCISVNFPKKPASESVVSPKLYAALAAPFDSDNDLKAQRFWASLRSELFLDSGSGVPSARGSGRATTAHADHFSGGLVESMMAHQAKAGESAVTGPDDEKKDEHLGAR